MDRNKLYIWKVLFKQLFLLPEKPEDLKIACDFDLPNQRVINNDAERTRNDLLIKQEKFDLELLLTYYCKETGIFYKQGLNELLAPFLFLSRSGLSLTETYLCFHHFISSYMPTIFIDADFKALQAQMLIFQRLLQYFHPKLSNFLDQLSIGPELYASPWFLTLFASRIENISIVLDLWENYMAENDPLYSVFIAAALVSCNKNKILSCEQSFVGQMLNTLTIPSPRHLSKILGKASEFKQNLPYSAYINLLSYRLDSLGDSDRVLSTLEGHSYLTVLPREILMRSYPYTFNCDCPVKTCQWCKKSSRPVAMAIIDCRSTIDKESGVLPSTFAYDYNRIDYSSITKLIERLNDLKGSHHIALLGPLCSGARTHEALENPAEIVFSALVQVNFPYVSFVEGGFRDCHDLALNLNLPIENHDSECCPSCNPDTNPVSYQIKKRMRNFRKSLLGKVKQAIDYAGTAFSRNSFPEPQDNVAQSLSALSFVQLPEGSSTQTFACRKLDRRTGETLSNELALMVSVKELLLCSGPPYCALERSEIKDLVKITSKRQRPNTLTFYFKDAVLSEIKRSYTLKSQEEARNCIAIVSNYFNALVPHSYASSV